MDEQTKRKRRNYSEEFRRDAVRLVSEEMGPIELEIFYPGYFLPTFGVMVFDITFDDQVVIEGGRYLQGFSYRTTSTPGPHKLEILSRNILSRLSTRIPFYIEFPQPGSYKVSLFFDRWGYSRWKAPVVERVLLRS